MNKTEQNIKHESSQLHVTGTANFIDDVLLPENALHGYVVTSKIARGKLISYGFKQALKVSGVKSILCCKNIKGKNQMGVLKEDEPVLVDKDIDFIGQGLFLIAAENEKSAIKASKLIHYETEELTPVIHIEDSIKKDWKLHPTITMERGDINGAFSNAKHTIENTILSGAQEHWYLETQIAVAFPNENNQFKVLSSTQHPSETQTLVAQALNINKHQVEIEARRLGGGFGGKETQANMVAIWASILAQHTKQAVKIKLNRIQDQSITGKRHPFMSNYKIGFDSNGIIKAYHVNFNVNAGYSLDLSLPIMARARTHAENAYYIPNIKIESTCWKTNLPSNTAFRGFGSPQAVFAIENAIEQIALVLNKDSAEIRKLNLYQENKNNITPYGQLVENNQLQLIFNQLISKSDYSLRKEAIKKFNNHNKYKKKGIGITPIKFGISFNTPFLNQAGALINIYTDGSIIVNHGGIEMGQGLHTKIQQIVANEFGLPIEKVIVSATNTSKVPNTSATAASSGTDLNGMAALKASTILKQRIAKMLCNEWKVTCNNDENCADLFKFTDNNIILKADKFKTITFSESIKKAYTRRVNLSAQGFYATPNLHFDKQKQQGKPFHYFVFGLSISEIQLDILTGHHKILRTDILHDTGSSINKAIDIGQIEGAFIQGMGWCTMEEIKWDKKGNVMNNSPDTYKIPGIRNIPAIFNVEIFKNNSNSKTVYKSKAVGEPPFLYGLSVFFAIKNALNSINDNNESINLNIPATNEKILTLIAQLKK